MSRLNREQMLYHLNNKYRNKKDLHSFMSDDLVSEKLE